MGGGVSAKTLSAIAPDGGCCTKRLVPLAVSGVSRAPRACASPLDRGLLVRAREELAGDGSWPSQRPSLGLSHLVLADVGHPGLGRPHQVVRVHQHAVLVVAAAAQDAVVVE